MVTIPVQYTIAFRDGLSTHWAHLLMGDYGAPPFDTPEAACDWFEARKKKIHERYQVRVHVLINGDVGREIIPDLRRHVRQRRAAAFVSRLRGIFGRHP